MKWFCTLLLALVFAVPIVAAPAVQPGLKISQYPNAPTFNTSDLMILAVTNTSPSTNKNMRMGDLAMQLTNGFASVLYVDTSISNSTLVASNLAQYFGSNLVVVLAGTNTAVGLTSTNGTNYYTVSSQAGEATPGVAQAPGTTTIVVDGSVSGIYNRTSVLTSAASVIFSNLTIGLPTRWWGLSSNGAWDISVPQSHDSNTVSRGIEQPFSNTWVMVEALAISAGWTNFDSESQGYTLGPGTNVVFDTNAATRHISVSAAGSSGGGGGDQVWTNDAGLLYPLSIPTLFNIDANGDITKLKNVVYSFPASQGAFGTVLQNSGAGILNWSTNFDFLIITNLTVVNNTILSNVTVKGDLIITNIVMGGVNLRTNQYTTNISDTPVKGSFWFGGTNGAPVTNNARVGMEWVPVMRSFRLGELGAQAAIGPDSIYAVSNYWHPTNVGFGSIAMGSNVMAQAAYSTILNGINNVILTNAIGSSILGGSNNIIATNAVFSVVSGGSRNSIRINSFNGSVGGGDGNNIFGAATYSTIGGGFENSINNGSIRSTVGGGALNSIGNGTFAATASTISGGRNNQADSADGTVGGGSFNVISAAVNTGSTIGGGNANGVREGSIYATIGGGNGNIAGVTAFDGADYSTISGGWNNLTGGSSDLATIAGGRDNKMENSSRAGIILGGVSNYLASGAGMQSIFGNFITNTAGASTIEIGHGANGGNNRKLRVNESGAKVLTHSGAASVGGTLVVSNSPIASAGAVETNLISYSVGAHVLTNTNDRLMFRASGRFAATANAKQIKVVYGSQTVLDTGSQIVNSGSWTIEGEIIRTGNTSQSVNAEFHGAGVTLFTTANSVDLAQTNGIATILKLTGTAAGDGDITNRTLVVTWHPSP